jgi:hypothetical protein
MSDSKIIDFFSIYDEPVFGNALQLRKIVLAALPDIIEELDVPAKMVGYSYGRKYAEMICTIIPSKKGLKLGFNRGIDLPDPDKLLEGTGKISRYVEIKESGQIKSPALKNLIKAGLEAYKERMGHL